MTSPVDWSRVTSSPPAGTPVKKPSVSTLAVPLPVAKLASGVPSVAWLRTSMLPVNHVGASAQPAPVSPTPGRAWKSLPSSWSRETTSPPSLT